MIGEVIKEYLVSLGVQIDKPGFAAVDSTINKTSNTINAATGSWSRDFIKASGIISAALAGLTTSVVGVMKATSKQDLAMDKYARSMMISKDAAWEMKQAVDALGESVQDIQLNPELLGRYRALVNDGRSMKVGGDYSETMKNFRDLIFEFTRLKQEAGYALQWVSYYLMKYLTRPLSDAKKSFKGINDSIIKNMPVWTEKVARALVYIINIGRSLWSFIKAIGKSIYDMWNAFPRGVKIATAALMGFFMLLRATPLGRMITLVSTLLLLIDDYFGHMEGRQAAFGEFWDKSRRKVEDLSRVLKPFANSTKELLAALSKLAFTVLKMVKEGLQGIFEEIEKQKALPELVKAVKDVAQGITDILDGLNELLIELQKSELVRKFWRTFKEGVVDSLKQVSYLLSGLGHLGSAIGKLMAKKYDEAHFHAAMFQAYMTASGANFLDQNSKGFFGMSPPNDDKIKSIDNYLKDTQGRAGVENHCTIYTNEVYEKGAGLIPGVDFSNNTWAPDRFEEAKKMGILREFGSQEDYIANMRPGDEVHWWYGNGKRETDHVGIVGADGKVYQWGTTGGTQGVDPNYAQIIGIARPDKLNAQSAPQQAVQSAAPQVTAADSDLEERRRLWTTPLYKSIPAAREKESGESFTGWLGSKIIDFFGGFSQQASLLNMQSNAYADYYNGGATTARIGDTNVNVAVTVAGSNASAQDIGNAVATQTVSKLEQRSQYVLQNRTLNGGPTWT